MKSRTDVNDIRVDDRLVDYAARQHPKSLDASTETLSIVVPFTTPALTRAALRHAGLCSELDVNVYLLDIQVVPFPCPLDQPPINKEYSQMRLKELLAEGTVRAEALVLYTRDWVEGFRRVLGPQSLVVIAIKKRWWPTREKKLARALRAAGHQVVLLPVR